MSMNKQQYLKSAESQLAAAFSKKTWRTYLPDSGGRSVSSGVSASREGCDVLGDTEGATGESSS